MPRRACYSGGVNWQRSRPLRRLSGLTGAGNVPLAQARCSCLPQRFGFPLTLVTEA